MGEEGHRGNPLGELLPPLSRQQAFVESNRCLYCYDAPCTHACPTHIDIPRFIKKIATENLLGSAKTILEANLLGATCARVCPVQELCEGACVLGSEHRPIAIGRLQRYAMDHAGTRAFASIRPTHSGLGSVGVVGAGPAGLSCAGELAKLGYAVTVYERRDLPGGLSTYGIIGLREPVEVSVEEVRMIEGLGVQVLTGRELGENLSLDELTAAHDAVFLGVGLGPTPEMAIPGEENVVDGLTYIEASKFGRESLAVGRRVLVIGAGNTAIDCATIAKRLGAESVTLVYRRGENEVTAHPHELEFIKLEGVTFRYRAQPVRVLMAHGKVTGLECVEVALGPPDRSGRAAPRPIQGSDFVLEADQIVKAIGQERSPLARRLGLAVEGGYIRVSESFETSRAGVFAGGDAILSRSDAFTVRAVQDGKLAARAIHARLSGGAPVHRERTEVAR